MSSSLCTCYPL